MMAHAVPTNRELRARIEAKIAEARQALQEAESAVAVTAGQRAEWDRLMRALEALSRRVRDVLADPE